MNWRLLTEAEKRENKRMRIARCKMREKHLRDEAMIMRLGQMLPSADLMEDVLSPFEAFSMLYRPLQKGRAMEPLIQLRLCRPGLLEAQSPVDPVDSPHHVVAAPVLHRSRRSRIYPWLVPPVRVSLPAGMSLAELKDEADRWKSAPIDPYVTLDLLHSFTGSWQQAADMELQLGLITTPIRPDTIAEIARAREFWNNWSAGCHHHQTASKAGLLPKLEGINWACFDHAGLMELLPGVRLPRSVCRDFYLLRLEGSVIRRDHRLVICSRNGHDLAIHPL
ncbi:hypothetical protein [Prosthecobacter sp.]|jgi:hypothetical protein|uniref:hypothetical protein n=1 Tax=Prosthecobacter sp. TaxID=1965333 RepID=UPI0037CBE988